MDWIAVFDQYEVQSIVLDPEMDGLLAEVLRACREWVVESEDDEAVVFVRAESLADAA